MILRARRNEGGGVLVKGGKIGSESKGFRRDEALQLEEDAHLRQWSATVKKLQSLLTPQGDCKTVCVPRGDLITLKEPLKYGDIPQK